VFYQKYGKKRGLSPISLTDWMAVNRLLRLPIRDILYKPKEDGAE